MQILAKFLAGICAILFMISGVIALLLFNVERQAFSSDTYKRAFEDQKLYDRMPAILASALGTSIAGNENADTYLKTLTVSDWEASITSILPPEELKTLTDNTLDATFDYINGKSDSAVVSLLPIKTHMTEASSVDAVKQILRAQPACTTEQLTEMAIGILSGGDLILCSPPEEVLGLITPLIETQLQVITVSLPDQVTLISNARSGTPNDPRLKLNRIRLAMKVTPFLPLVLLIGMTIFAVRGLADWLKWWGWPFLITGGSSLLIALLGAPILGVIFERVMQNQGADLIPPVLLATLRETVSAVIREMLKPVATEGLALAVLGLAMLLVSLNFGKRERDEILKRLEV